ncbi:thromboxane A2 receptor isoform X2 [Boleophthalmus pectinirostris]|uniref:thromboxane A2 receptor isoform X2 n=1 Tax=Boleophthalmus pectinirostris TaxID=150288 RepID=UPI002432F4B7|nr:thromboxane A2 receptor isoform X2 [Boleophthalmus pectinirostris]
MDKRGRLQALMQSALPVRASINEDFQNLSRPPYFAPSFTMNTSHLNESTPLCYSINSPPFQYHPTIASAYFSSIFSVLGLTSNLVAFIVLLQSFKRAKSRSRSFFLVFLGGLVVTDFLGLLVTGSIVVSFHVTHFNWRQLDPNCHFCNFMGMSMVFYGLCPLLLGATMAIERFSGINCPFSRSQAMPKKRTVIMVLVVWMIAGSISLLPIFGVGSYHMQMPGSWCFNISSMGNDKIFSLVFSLVGLTCLTVSFVLNTVSVVTLIRVCCGPGGTQRRRDHEVEMMVQLILIMVIASVCWCPLLGDTLVSAVTGNPVSGEKLLFYIRMATCNQILDPWIYIMCQWAKLRSLLRRLYCLAACCRSSTCCCGFALPRGTRSSIPGSTSFSEERYLRGSIPTSTGPDVPF